MLVSTTTLFDKCYGKFAIGALNIWSMEQVLALFSAGEKSSSPFIVQMTPVARNYANGRMLSAMIREAAKIYPNAVFATHIDHGNEEHIIDAIESGDFTSVMIDASHDPFDQNVARTRKIVSAGERPTVSRSPKCDARVLRTPSPAPPATAKARLRYPFSRSCWERRVWAINLFESPLFFGDIYPPL